MFRAARYEPCYLGMNFCAGSATMSLVVWTLAWAAGTLYDLSNSFVDRIEERTSKYRIHSCVVHTFLNTVLTFCHDIVAGIVEPDIDITYEPAITSSCSGF